MDDESLSVWIMDGTIYVIAGRKIHQNKRNWRSTISIVDDNLNQGRNILCDLFWGEGVGGYDEGKLLFFFLDHT